MWQQRVLPLAIGVLAACAHGRTHRPGEEHLTGVDFEGNHRLSRNTLLTGLALHRVLQRDEAPDPYLVQIDADRIRGEYLRNGYLDAGVRSRVERKGDAARVIYTIEEGKRASTRVVVNGLPDDVPVHDVRAKLPLQDGKPFSYEPYDLAKPLLLGAVQDKGYAHAQLDASVIADRADHTAIVELDYTPGPRCTFGPVEITGVTGELATAVRERLAFAPGQLYSTSALTQTQRNLYGFGRFSTVRVRPDRGDNDNVVGIKVAVAESARHEVQLGGGFGIDPTGYEIRGRAGYSIAGWPFPLDTVSLDFRPAYAYLRDGGYEPRVRALARLERKDLFWTYTRGEIAGGFNYLANEAFTSTGPIARLGFETPLGTSKLSARVGWRFEEAWFPKINSLLDQPMYADLRHQIGIDRTERLGAYEQSLISDLRDNPLETRLGAYGELHATEGTAFAGSAYQYLELVGDARGYVPVFAGVVLAGRARYGAIWGDVPPTERLFSGGAVSHRGFGERKLSPYIRGEPPNMKGTTLTLPYGGAELLETSIEARIPITTIRKLPLGFVAFLDGGDVQNQPGDINLGKLNWAPGVGLRLTTPVGPVRLDVAYRINRTGPMDPEPGSKYAYHLTIGEAF
ncbi:MAG TPA: BamA/TamA family outer membrane protein [Kofleriaceae bacterium]